MCAWGSNGTKRGTSGWEPGFGNFIYYSDTFGATWKAAPVTQGIQANECMVGQLANNSVVLISRLANRHNYAMQTFTPDLRPTHGRDARRGRAAGARFSLFRRAALPCRVLPGPPCPRGGVGAVPTLWLAPGLAAPRSCHSANPNQARRCDWPGPRVFAPLLPRSVATKSAGGERGRASPGCSPAGRGRKGNVGAGLPGLAAFGSLEPG